MTLDEARVRADFPVLSRPVHGKPLVYLDSSATSQKPRQVIEAMADYYERYNSNVHRGIHTLAEEATAAYEDARASVFRFVNAPDDASCVFTKNATEAINLVAYSWVRRRLGPGDEILLTEMEHHSNLVPWQMAAADCGATIRYLGVTDEGYLDLSRLDSLSPKTKLVAVTAMSNVLGTIPDLSRITAAARSVGAVVLVDGAQFVPHAPCDFESLDADFLAFSGHKMLGPTGVGVLVARTALLDEMPPFLGGGEMILDVTLQGPTFNEVPYKFEAGTMMIAEAIGLRVAVEYLSNLGMDNVRAHEMSIVRYGLKALSSTEGVVVYGPQDAEHRGAALSFNVFDDRGELIHPHDMGTLLDQHGIAIRAGHHCAKPLMRRYDVPAMCRASAYIYTTETEIDSLISGIEATRRFFMGA